MTKTTYDGTHPYYPGAQIMGADVADLYGSTYSAWPNTQRNFAMSCVLRPPRATADAVAAFRTAIDAAGITLFYAHWLNTPLDNGDTGQIRRVDINGGFWDLCDNPSSDGSWNVDYSIYGTGSDGSVSYLRPLCIPSTHFASGMTNNMAFIMDAADWADSLSLFATAASGSADKFVFTPWNAGSADIRFNTGTTLSIPNGHGMGLFIGNLTNGTVDLYCDGTLVGTGSRGAGSLGGNGIRLYSQIGGTGLTRRRTRFWALTTHALTTAQVTALQSAAATLIAYGVSQQITGGYNSLAYGYFESMSVAPSTAWKTWYNANVIVALDNAGYLSSLDHLGIYHGHDVQVGLLNIIRPRALNTIAGGTGTITFTAKAGSIFTTAPIVTNVGPNNGSNGVGLHMQQNNHTLIWRGNILGQTAAAVAGALELSICPRNTTSANHLITRSASGTSDDTTSGVGTLSGVHTVSVERTSSTQYQVYIDGIANGSPISRTSAAFSASNPLNIGARSGGGVDTVEQHRWVLMGAAVGAPGQLAIHNLLVAADAAQP